MPPRSNNAHGSLTRRQLLMAAGAGVVGMASCGSARRLPLRPLIECPWHQPVSGAFAMGVASGDAFDTSVRVSTCHQDQSTQVELSVMEVDGVRPGAEVQRVALAKGDGGFLFHDVTGLRPGTQHVFAFLEVDDSGAPVRRSPMGQFRTAPSADALEQLTFTASSCSKRGFNFDPLLRASEIDGAFHMFLGDTSYNDGAHDVDTFRAAWRRTLERHQAQALLSATNIMATWDDHEIHDNWEPGKTPRAVVQAAQQAFREHMPVRMAQGQEFRLWRSMRWGRTAEVFMLDLRSEHHPTADQLISRSQMDFLKAGLKNSTAVFKVIGTPVPITRAAGPAGYVSPRDRWGGYPAQRREILSFVEDEGITGVLWIGGDVHYASVGRVSRHGPGSRQLEVMVGPAGQMINPMFASMVGPQWDFTGGFNNIGAFQLDPHTRRATVTIVDRSGVERFARTYAL